MKKVIVARTGTANTASVLAGLTRAGAQPVLTHDPDAVRDADHVVLPGVGAFAAARTALDEAGLTESLTDRIEAGRPTLGICLGLQLLCASSDESPGVMGLAVVDGHIERFGDDVRVPQLGWNEVLPDDRCLWIEPGYAYFANSYRLRHPPAGWNVARTDHGGRFVSAIERGDVLACQFHPELSGPWGLALLKRWLEGSKLC